MTVALLFDALGFGGHDPRDFIVGLAVIFNSAEIAGVDPRSLCSGVAAAVGGAAGDLISAFVAREPRDRSMEAFRLTAVPDPDGGFEIKPDWVG